MKRRTNLTILKLIRLFGPVRDLVFVESIEGFGMLVKGLNEGLKDTWVDGSLRRWHCDHLRRPASRRYPIFR